MTAPKRCTRRRVSRSIIRLTPEQWDQLIAELDVAADLDCDCLRENGRPCDAVVICDEACDFCALPLPPCGAPVGDVL